MARLAGDVTDIPEDKMTTSSTAAGKVFTCDDGVQMPYEVIGVQELEGKAANFVVCHDFFDTFESSAIFFESITKRFMGCQVLVFNYPGQASTVFAGGAQNAKPSAVEVAHGANADGSDRAAENVFNNAHVAERMHELLQGLESDGSFVTSYQPFHIVGFGNGGCIASYFAAKYGSKNAYRRSLKSLALFNSFAHVDNQLAAILHSSVNVFSCFPSSRPDLPVSYFTRFLFSDAYLQRVDPNLVLNLYTAVSNPISLDGRIRLCRGALNHIDIRKELSSIKVPLILVQSTENVLVAPTNVDPFLEGRPVTHIWSHQHTGTRLTDKSHKQLAKILNSAGRNDAFVVWLRAGHEIRQEAKRLLVDMLDRLADPRTADLDTTTKGRQKATDEKALIEEDERDDEYDEDDRRAFGRRDKDREERGVTFAEQEATGASASSSSAAAAATAAATSSTTEQADVAAGSGDAFEKNPVSEVLMQFEEQETETGEERKQRLEETELEFQNAMRVHKQLKLKKAEELRRRREKEKKTQGKGGQGQEQHVQEEEEEEKRKQKRDEKGARSMDEIFDPTKVPMKSILDAHNAKTEAKAIKVNMHGVRSLEQERGQLEMKLKRFEHERQERRRREEEEMEQALRLVEQEQMKRRRQYANEDTDRMARIKKDMDDKRRKREEEDRQREKELRQQEEALNIKAESQLRYGGDVGLGVGVEQVLRDGDDRQRVVQVSAKESGQARETGQGQSQSRDHGALAADAQVLVSEQESKRSKEERMKIQEKERRRLEIEQLTGGKNKSLNIKDMFQDLERADEEMKRMGILKMEDYEKVKREMQEAELDRRAREATMEAHELQKYQEGAAHKIQAGYRGMAGRKRFKRIRAKRHEDIRREMAAEKIQAGYRGRVGRELFEAHRRVVMREREELRSAQTIQRTYRGHLGYLQARMVKEEKATRFLQRVFRGHQGRDKAASRRAYLEHQELCARMATKLQATFRMHRGRLQYLNKRIEELAAVQVQRIWRGARGRRIAGRRKNWEGAKPGPERLELGIRLIEESKNAFEAQQEEINALHRAQERAEMRVSEVHAELKESEGELRLQGRGGGGRGGGGGGGRER